MASVRSDPTELLDAVRSALIGSGSGDTQILDVQLGQKEDERGEDGWWLTLFLPRPQGQSWSPESTADIKRVARRAFDAVASERHLSLQNPTVVIVTTRDAPLSEIAVDEHLSADAGTAVPDHRD